MLIDILESFTDNHNARLALLLSAVQANKMPLHTLLCGPSSSTLVSQFLEIFPSCQMDFPLKEGNISENKVACSFLDIDSYNRTLTLHMLNSRYLCLDLLYRKNKLVFLIIFVPIHCLYIL